MRSGSGLLCLLILASVFLAGMKRMADGQMTFSDGWVKRAMVVPIGSENTKKLKENRLAQLNSCRAAYTRSVALIQRELVELYDAYQRCEDKADLRLQV